MAARQQSIQFDPRIVERLACPACHAALCLDAMALVCSGCGRAYPIVDGIPVLIPGSTQSSPG